MAAKVVTVVTVVKRLFLLNFFRHHSFSKMVTNARW
jgi:hypothetical protein